jgi:PPK2 family polyphosphate:nucleotide phosphotransferase
MASRMEELLDLLRVPPGKRIDLKKDYDPGFHGHWLAKEEAEETLAEGIQALAEFQDKLYAQDNYSLLIVLQAMDAAGKDGTIKHVMSGLNPQGVEVHTYKAPSPDELDHDYLWRNYIALPRRGNIGIFNRSHYEEVLVVRVHPEFLAGQKLPPALKDDAIWQRRFQEINNFEQYLVQNGIVVLKFFLYVSKEAQKERFLERALLPDKNWKFSAADLKERERWDEYLAAYEDMFNHTSTEWAPWYIVPADHKWFTRLAVAGVIHHTLEKLDLAYPTVSEAQKQALAAAVAELKAEGGGAPDPAVLKAEAKAAAEVHPDQPLLVSPEAAAAAQSPGAEKTAKKKNKKAGKKR